MAFRKLVYLPLIFLFIACQPETTLTWIAPSAVKERTELEDYTSNLKVADRHYVGSVLTQVFDITTGPSKDHITNNILNRPEFGGSCDSYSSSDLGASTIEFLNERCINSIDVVQVSTNNPMRYSLMTKACEFLVADSKNMNVIRTKLGMGTKWAYPKDEMDPALDKAWSLFFPYEGLDKSLRSALFDITKVSSTPEAAWKHVMLTLCISPEWQAF